MEWRREGLNQIQFYVWTGAHTHLQVREPPRSSTPAPRKCKLQPSRRYACCVGCAALSSGAHDRQGTAEGKDQSVGAYFQATRRGAEMDEVKGKHTCSPALALRVCAERAACAAAPGAPDLAPEGISRLVVSLRKSLADDCIVGGCPRRKHRPNRTKGANDG